MQLLVIHLGANSFRKGFLEHIDTTYDSKFRRCLPSKFEIESQINGEGLSVEWGREALVWCVNGGEEIMNLAIHASLYLIEPETKVLIVEITESPQVLIKRQPSDIIVFCEDKS